MQCPKCKKDLDAKSVKCDRCGTRVATVCKKCGTVNPIRATECSNCHEVLLKICTECGSANLPNAKSCRKCGVEFVVKSNEQDSSAKTRNRENRMEYKSQQKIKSALLDAIKDPDSTVISLNGDSGSGKNLVIRYVVNDLKKAKLVWLHGTCTQVTQLSPFGYFQDLLLTFFNISVKLLLNLKRKE